MALRYLLLLALVSGAAPVAAQNWSPWRSLGPFEHSPGAAPQTSLAQELPNLRAAGVGPDYARVHRGKAGLEIAWLPLAGVLGGSRGLDLGRLHLRQDLRWPSSTLRSPGWHDNAAVFLHRSVRGSAGTKFDLRLGADDGLRIWWNAELVFSNDVVQAYALQSELQLTLKEGLNHLLVSISNAGGPWSFRMAEASDLGATHGVPRAVERGARWLLDTQYLDGSWEAYPGYAGGVAALGAYTLLHCGVAPEHPSVRRALAFARSSEENYTYSRSTEIMALCALGDRADRKYLRRRVEELVEMQESTGLYSYPEHPGGGEPPADLSLTTFAAMALSDAKQAGLQIPKDLWLSLLSGLESCQAKDEQVRSEARRGYRYRPWTGEPSGSMTAAGIAVGYLAERGLGTKLRKLDRRRGKALRAAALRWLADAITFESNAGNADRQYYFIYGIERVGSFLELERIGGVEWYRAGANYLLEQQQPTGAWHSANGPWESTVFALLFLSRATRPNSDQAKIFQKTWFQWSPSADVRLRGYGDTPLVLYLEAISKSAARAQLWPGELEPRVLKVEYLAQLRGDAASSFLLASVEGSGEKPAGSLRFAMREELPSNGLWELSARVTLLAPAASSKEQPERVILLSETLKILIDGVLTPGELDYARHREHNLLGDATASASSELGQGSPAGHLCDARQSTSWLSAAGDAQPSITIEPAKPIKFRRLLLSHHNPSSKNQSSRLPIRLRITLNGASKKAIFVDVEPNPLRKIVVDFGKTRKVKKITIEIVEAASGALSQGSLGFAEMELLL